ncbi:MAG: hypothetical protein ACFB14_14410 [Leptolyngbyaceae cyanobacterium]
MNPGRPTPSANRYARIQASRAGAIHPRTVQNRALIEGCRSSDKTTNPFSGF